MIRFYNGRVLHFTHDGVDVRSEEVWTDGGRICYVGPGKASEKPFDRQIDLRGDLLMPGFKNAHTHTAASFFRSMADDLPLHQWLNERVFPNEKKLNDEAIYYFSLLGILEYVSSGITASFDMYFFNDSYVKANIDAGFRTVICSAMNDFDADPTNIEREFLKFNNVNPLIGYRLGIHAEYTTSMERMEYMASLARKHHAPAYAHISETRSEVEDCIRRYGLTPPQLLDKLGMFDYGGGGFHCIWFTDEDMELFARKKLWAVTCPASNLKLASGIAPICKSVKKGMQWAVGTDGAGSNNALDMFREMYLVTALQKYLENDAAACDANDVLKMACINGSYAMGLEDADGVEVGKLADLTVISLNAPNMQPLHNISKNVVYSGSKQNVRLTMVNGKILYEDGEYFVGETPENIYRNVQRCITENGMK